MAGIEVFRQEDPCRDSRWMLSDLVREVIRINQDRAQKHVLRGTCRRSKYGQVAVAVNSFERLTGFVNLGNVKKKDRVCSADIAWISLSKIFICLVVIRCLSGGCVIEWKPFGVVGA
jgi:hypothetical protein